MPPIPGPSSATQLANDVPAFFVANADGSGVTPIGPAGFRIIQWPAWSPSGREILFSAGSSVSAFNIYVMNADGSNIRRLTSDTGTQNCGRWSPDGSKIIFESRRRDDGQQLVMMARDGSSQEVMVRGDGDCGDWSPDSPCADAVARDVDRFIDGDRVGLLRAIGFVRVVTRLHFRMPQKPYVLPVDRGRDIRPAPVPKGSA
jgi:dipeptidyl aminopeptidase/acylaminoacyl peptidase